MQTGNCCFLEYNVILIICVVPAKGWSLYDRFISRKSIPATLTFLLIGSLKLAKWTFTSKILQIIKFLALKYDNNINDV